MGGVCDQQPGIGEAAGRLCQFFVEPRPCFPPQFDAVSTCLEGDIDKLPDGTLAALEFIFKLHSRDQNRSVGGSCCVRFRGGVL